jgi:hypothetical protein
MPSSAVIDRGVDADIVRQCRYPVRALLLIGSLAEGFANAASDIDVIAIVADPPRGRFRVCEHPIEHAGRPGSIMYLTERMLRRRLATLDKLYRAGGHLTDGLATRVANARVVFDADGVGAALITAANSYRPSADTLREMMRICLGFLHDALGSRAAGDHATAILMARQAASAAVDCHLLDRNQRNLKPKWHLRRLQALGSRGVLEPYRRVLGVDQADGGQSARAVEDAQRLLCEVLHVSDLRNYTQSPLFEPAGVEAAPGRESVRK